MADMVLWLLTISAGMRRENECRKNWQITEKIPGKIINNIR
jgi:hypothetical protein